MSRWIKSVNSLLEKLDDQVETVVDDVRQQQHDDDDVNSSRNAVGHILSRRGLALDHDENENEEEYFEEEEQDSDYYDEQGEEWLDSEEYDEDEETEEEVIDLEEAHTSGAPSGSVEEKPPPLFPKAPEEVQVPHTCTDKAVEIPVAAPVEKTVAPRPPPLPKHPAPAAEHSSSSSSSPSGLTEQSHNADTASSPESAVKVEMPPHSDADESAPRELKLPRAAPRSEPPPQPRPPPVSGLSRTSVDSTPSTSGQWSLPSHPNHPQQQKSQQGKELKKVEAEARQLRKHVLQLHAQLEASEAECRAQREELQRAAERLERDRQRHEEEREDLCEEQDEEVDQLKQHYETLLAEQQGNFQSEIEELKERCKVEEAMRVQEGGDWTQELEDSVQRERDALTKLGQVREENSSLRSKNTKLETQQSALQSRLETATQNAFTASEREREAEGKLDAALSMHSRQLSQRQARESELERTIADLGAALAAAQQEEQKRGTETVGSRADKEQDFISLKEQLELAVDELETVKAQLSLEAQQCEALRQELYEISQERIEEASSARTRQEQYDREISDLNGTISRLQTTIRGFQKNDSPTFADADDAGDASDPAHAVKLANELDKARKQIASLSEQLIRQQSRNESSKTELLTLKNRLQASVARADDAEQALASASSISNQSDGGMSIPYGGSTMRRRTKGGRSRSNSSSVRSIRAALNLQPGRVSEGTEPFVASIDAIDSMAVETGAFLRHEPLARLGFLLYLFILHIWAFCLVLFHAHSFEKEHADFGSLTDKGGLGP